jgi:uncharacterized protein (DUF58 family)
MADLIPPEVRSRLRSLRIVPRRALGMQGIGQHRSAARGTGTEFAQYRAYEQGDDLRRIDWKLYARSERLFVREAEREGPVAVRLLIDASGSMAQADPDRPDWTRLDAAKAMAACLAEVAAMHGDRIGLMAMSDAGIVVIDAATGPRQRDRMLIELLRLERGTGFADEEALGPVWERVGPEDLAIVFSDGFDPGLVAMTEKLAAAGREVLFVEMLTVAEDRFPISGGFRFRDPETGETVTGDARALREAFLAEFGAARAQLHARLDALGIRHVPYVLDEPVDAPLRRLFA